MDGPDEPSGPSQNHYTDWESEPTKGPLALEDSVNHLFDDVRGVAVALNDMKLEYIYDFIKKKREILKTDERVGILLNLLKEMGFDNSKRTLVRLSVKYIRAGKLQFQSLSKMAMFISTTMAAKLDSKGEISDGRLQNYFILYGKEFKEKEDIDTFKELLEATHCNGGLMNRISNILDEYHTILPVSAGLDSLHAAMQIYPNTSHQYSDTCSHNTACVSRSLGTALQILENTVASLERKLES